MLFAMKVLQIVSPHLESSLREYGTFQSTVYHELRRLTCSWVLLNTKEKRTLFNVQQLSHFSDCNKAVAIIVDCAVAPVCLEVRYFCYR